MPVRVLMAGVSPGRGPLSEFSPGRGLRVCVCYLCEAISQKKIIIINMKQEQQNTKTKPNAKPKRDGLCRKARDDARPPGGL